MGNDKGLKPTATVGNRSAIGWRGFPKYPIQGNRKGQFGLTGGRWICYKMRVIFPVSSLL